MKKIQVIMLSLLVLSGFMLAQNKVRIKDIQENLSRYRNEVVRIEGFITQYIDASARTTARYYIKGDWGQVITVRTAEGSPVVGQRYEVKGVVDFDSAFNEPFLTEIKRVPVGTGLNEAPEPAAGAQDVKVLDEEEGTDNKTLILILAGAAVVLIIVLLGVLLMLKKRSQVTPAYMTPIPGVDNASADAPKPERVIEGKTIKIKAPPANTLKLLPGRLTVESGDDSVKEIRFYLMPDSKEMELTFGRAAGKSFNHVQLKPQTVSAKQAKIVFRDNKHILINYSETNPTTVNGNIVQPSHSVELKTGDRVEMGEVVFIFSR